MGFSKDDIVKMVNRHGGSGKVAVVLQQAKPLKERGFTNPLIVKALCYLGTSSLHPEVTLETIHAQLALCKQLKWLRQDFFRYFEAERMQRLACYHHPDSHQALSAVLDFMQTDSQASTSRAFARLFAQHMNKAYATAKAEGTLEIDDNDFRAEGTLYQRLSFLL